MSKTFNLTLTITDNIPEWTETDGLNPPLPFYNPKTKTYEWAETYAQSYLKKLISKGVNWIKSKF